MRKSEAKKATSTLALGVPELPQSATTSTGVDFDPRFDVWDYYDGLDHVMLDFHTLETFLSENLIRTFKAVLMHAAQEISPSRIFRYFSCFTLYVNCLVGKSVIDSVTEEHVREFWSKDDIPLEVKTNFRSIIYRWVEHRYAGVGDGVMNFLVKQEAISNVLGESVRTWDPVSGPLTDNEFKSFYENLTDAYAQKNISTELFLIAWLVTSLGVRPRQIALLKVIDVKRSLDTGVVRYSLSMPRIKQRGQSPRDEMYEWPVIDEIGDLLYNQGLLQKDKYKAYMSNVEFAPLFSSNKISARRAYALEQIGTFKQALDGDNLDNSSGDHLLFHMSVCSILDRLSSVFSELNVVSERVREIVLGARRLRKTYGTRLAAENVPAPVIAQMMGHRDIKSSEPYIAATSQLQRRLDKTLTFELAPLAQAFRGELRSRVDDSSRAGAIVRDPRLVPSGDELGECKKSGHCGLSAPVACYTCKKFRPWKDAPHELIFNFLWEKREKRALGPENDAHMTMLHDRTLLAVAEVILQCQEVGAV